MLRRVLEHAMQRLVEAEAATQIAGATWQRCYEGRSIPWEGPAVFAAAMPTRWHPCPTPG
ncbi:MAG: hypothetical protein ACHQ4F_16255 [Candidatus Dormibacteria bacterium]